MKLLQRPGMPLFICTLLCLSIRLAEAGTPERPMLVYIGTYTGAKSKGIYVSRFDIGNGRLSAPESAVETKSPSFLAVHPKKDFLYAVGEVRDFGGKESGAVSAFRIDK